MEAGRYWAGGRSDPAQLKSDADVLQLVNYTVEVKEEHFEILEDNFKALKVFLACSNHFSITQLVNKTRVNGINPSTILSVMTAYKIEDTEQVLDDVQIIESGALEVINQ